MLRTVEFNSLRRFGVEIELNTTSGKIRELLEDESPEGAHEVAAIVAKATRKTIEIQPWSHGSTNNTWLIKPDRSCGLELCSPILKGWHGLRELMIVADSLRSSGIQADDRCSLHVHLGVADMSLMEKASVVARYIKCEPTFLEAMPSHRRCNRYCQCLGTSNLFRHSEMPTPSELLRRVSLTKYHSFNAYHMRKGCRETMECRVGDHTMCLDAYALKNWVRFLLHFFDVAKELGMPSKPTPGNRWSGLAWLEPEDVLRMLRLDCENLSPGMRQVRSWLASRLLELTPGEDLPPIWSSGARGHAIEGLRRYGGKVDEDLYGHST